MCYFSRFTYVSKFQQPRGNNEKVSLKTGHPLKRYYSVITLYKKLKCIIYDLSIAYHSLIGTIIKDV